MQVPDLCQHNALSQVPAIVSLLASLLASLVDFSGATLGCEMTCPLYWRASSGCPCILKKSSKATELQGSICHVPGSPMAFSVCPAHCCAHRPPRCPKLRAACLQLLPLCLHMQLSPLSSAGSTVTSPREAPGQVLTPTSAAVESIGSVLWSWGRVVTVTPFGLIRSRVLWCPGLPGIMPTYTCYPSVIKCRVHISEMLWFG